MSSRELLERRRSPGRVVAVIGGVLALLVGAAAALALGLLPPVLASTPRERLTASATTVTVHDATTSATVTLGEGWLLLGVGPFLPTDAQTLVSPDDAYRLVLTLEPAARPFDATAPTSPVSLDPEDLDALLARTGGATSTNAGPADAASTETSSSSGAGVNTEWSHETLSSGVTVSYADVVQGDRTTTVTLVAPAGLPAGAHALALVVTVTTAEAARYRTVTADLASTATLTLRPSGTSTPDGSVPAARGGRDER
ncbi:hypothetical protein [Herbiconiux sp. VKM Ac-2851]|uniref:hypothetical protein n=1 Tax=Herbiconiux sp. VKM Ac-2851 TaxID=2739025 RepID=UPI00156583E2|nr:hypothetical protein [Herbiconiux sp. VKM Ac-2851]NQX33377.1 hypothetical protein [Herbiconiux sp. VKM Ac-2851]